MYIKYCSIQLKDYDEHQVRTEIDEDSINCRDMPVLKVGHHLLCTIIRKAFWKNDSDLS
jgi:hypothetical protein